MLAPRLRTMVNTIAHIAKTVMRHKIAYFNHVTEPEPPMTDLSAFPITSKWTPQDPSVIQLFSFPTPNGVKASIALEEMGLPH